jgi:hypothetical protein
MQLDVTKRVMAATFLDKLKIHKTPWRNNYAMLGFQKKMLA